MNDVASAWANALYRTPSQTYGAIKEYFSQEGAVLAYNEDRDSCVYRTEQGKGCAVGCLIPDDRYQVSLEERGIDGIWGNPQTQHDDHTDDQIGDIFAWNGETKMFLGIAQRAHDSSQDVEEFLTRLDAAAVAMGLEVVEI